MVETNFITPIDLFKQYQDIEFKKGYEDHVMVDWRANLLTNRLHEEKKIVGDFNHRVRWVWDIIVDSLVRSQEYEKFPVLPEISFKSLTEALETFNKKIAPKLPVVSFSNEEFREIIGKEISYSQIKRIVQKFANITLKDVTIKLTILGEKIEYTIMNGKFATVYHKKDEENYHAKRYYFNISDAGFLFFQCYFYDLDHKIWPRGFYDLSRNGQYIYRYVSCFPKLYRSLNDLITYCNLVYDDKYLRVYKQRIEKALAELKKEKFIADWKTKIPKQKRAIERGNVYFDREKQKIIDRKKHSKNGLLIYYIQVE